MNFVNPWRRALPPRTERVLIFTACCKDFGPTEASYGDRPVVSRPIHSTGRRGIARRWSRSISMPIENGVDGPLRTTCSSWAESPTWRPALSATTWCASTSRYWLRRDRRQQAPARRPERLVVVDREHPHRRLTGSAQPAMHGARHRGRCSVLAGPPAPRQGLDPRAHEETLAEPARASQGCMPWGDSGAGRCPEPVRCESRRAR